MKKPIAWSFSILKLFEQCPRKYYHLKVAKSVKEGESQALVYGNEVHKAAEQYVGKGVALPPQFSKLKPTLESLKNIPGQKSCEVRLGLRKDGEMLTPCEFFGKGVWWRGIADLFIKKGSVAHSVDYKTGKNSRYSDDRQLDIVAVALFIHNPEIEKIKSGLAFVDIDEFIPKNHYRDNIPEYLASFDEPLDRFAVAHEKNIWNANPGPLCAYCPVTRCEHHRGNNG